MPFLYVSYFALYLLPCPMNNSRNRSLSVLPTCIPAFSPCLRYPVVHLPHPPKLTSPFDAFISFNVSDPAALTALVHFSDLYIAVFRSLRIVSGSLATSRVECIPGVDLEGSQVTRGCPLGLGNSDLSNSVVIDVTEKSNFPEMLCQFRQEHQDTDASLEIETTRVFKTYHDQQ